MPIVADAKSQRATMNDAIKKYRAKHGDTSELPVPPCLLELNDGDDENETLHSEDSNSTTVMVTTEDYGQAITLPSYRYGLKFTVDLIVSIKSNVILHTVQMCYQY